MSHEDYGDGADRRPRSSSPVRHDCERVRRFLEEHAARIMRASTRTDARDWANDAAAALILSDAFGHELCGTGAWATPLKGTDATASRHVRGTLRG